MKHAISNISIPAPCHEDWQNMLPAEKGRFCSSCQKTVTDFTALSNAEILSLLSSAGKICGRFSEVQLMVLNQEIIPQRSSLFLWQKLSLAAAFIGLLPFVKAEAKTKPNVEQRSVGLRKIIHVANTAVAYKRIHGKITGDGSDSSGLVGATVGIKGKQLSAATDDNGDFVLNVPVSPNLILVVRYLGYEDKEIKIDPAKETVYDLRLKPGRAFMGEVEIKKKQ